MPLLVLMNTDKVIFECLDKLTNFILDPEGATCSFEMAHGVGFYDYLAQRPDSRLSIMFDELMDFSNKMLFDKMMMVYGGFSEVVELMDVGGNEGSTLKHLISLYPDIKGINFDLHHVIARAPNLEGVKHVAGDIDEITEKAKDSMEGCYSFSVGRCDFGRDLECRKLRTQRCHYVEDI
uniref:O-methyltransferase C-terminal domain-containing protein n=1 Tax=Kalanchoe fedtschenkoi TaxID=63787 RepID=A0A7N1A5Z7_KALFE